MMATGNIASYIGLFCGGFFALIFLILGVVFLITNIRARKQDANKSKTGLVLGIIFLVIGACGFLVDVIVLIVSLTQGNMF